VSAPRCLILRAAGTNCDEETAHAWQLVGARPERLHVNRLIENSALVSNYQILTVPGGFSYGDDVAAGKILANQLKSHLADVLGEFIAADKLILGICNGFQVLVKAGLLPGGNIGADAVSLTWNDSAKFEERWVHLAGPSQRSIFLKNLTRLQLPVAHAEGKVAAADDRAAASLEKDQHVALRYVDAAGQPGPYPVNPNGSILDAAGLTDPTGRILGLMPHPERFAHRTHHPEWTRLPADRQPDGLQLFANAVNYFAV
jgi:phosphoribosylformylglycinamidine synthase